MTNNLNFILLMIFGFINIILFVWVARIHKSLIDYMDHTRRLTNTIDDIIVSRYLAGQYKITYPPSDNISEDDRKRLNEVLEKLR